MNIDDLPLAKDAEPYPFDESLPGSEHSGMDSEDRRQGHVTIEDLIKEGKEVDGVLFRLLGWPDGKVRRATLVRMSSKCTSASVMALWRGRRLMWIPAMCVVVTLEESNADRKT